MPVFDARAEAAKSAEEYPPFPWVGMDGETHHLPHPATLETGAATRLAEAEENGDMVAILRLFVELFPDSADALRALPINVLSQLLEQWMEGLDDQGKSPTPSSTPNRAARRSKRTSRSAAST